MTHTIQIRKQHAKGGSRPGSFHGPDIYVAVTSAPEGVEVPEVLNKAVLAKRGIEIRYFGEGYQQHKGPRSSFAKAVQAAEAWIKEQQEKEQQEKELDQIVNPETAQQLFPYHE